MTSIPSRLVAFLLLLATTCLCGSLCADQKFDDLRKAAEQGDASAQLDLGLAYRKGEGVAKDLVESVMWLRKAAEQGNAQAQFNLGCAYYFGNGVAKDHAEKAKWFGKAAQQGVAEAQWLLGESYYYGNGVAKDQVEGYAWVNLGAMTDEFAKKTRAVFEKGMTAQQIADGQKRSTELSALIKANKVKK